MKRKFALLLVLCLIFGLFGCTAADTNKQDNVENEYDEADSEYPDLYEYEFKYLQHQNEESMMFFGYNDGTEFADAARHRVKEVEQNLNCFISTEQIPKTTALTMLQTGLATGDGDWSALQMWEFEFLIPGMIRAGYLVPMSYVEGIIDYKDSAKWGAPKILQSYCYDNELYGLYPNYWPEFGFMSVDHLLCFNADLVAEAGVGDPRTLVEQGKWNRTALSDLVKDLTIERGEEKVYGFGCNQFHFYDMAFLTSDTYYVVETADGEFVNGLNTDISVDTFTWADKFYNENTDYIHPNRTDTYATQTAFCNSEISMILMHSYFIFSQSGKIAYEVENQGLLPFPLQDGDDSQNWKGQFETMQYSTHIPMTALEPESAAHILNAIYEPLEGFETAEDLEAYYLRTTFHDPRDYTLLMNLMDNLQFTYRAIAVQDAKGDASDILTQISRRESTPATVLDANKTKYETSYYPAILNMLESAKAVFGE